MDPKIWYVVERVIGLGVLCHTSHMLFANPQFLPTSDRPNSVTRRSEDHMIPLRNWQVYLLYHMIWRFRFKSSTYHAL